MSHCCKTNMNGSCLHDKKIHYFRICCLPFREIWRALELANLSQTVRKLGGRNVESEQSERLILSFYKNYSQAPFKKVDRSIRHGQEGG